MIWNASEGANSCGGTSYRTLERGGSFQPTQEDRKPEESGRSAAGQVEGEWCG